MRLAIVASRFNAEVVDLMLERAVARAKELGLQVAAVVRVPGAFEIPPAVQQLLQRSDVDGAVALGAVITGETKHDEVIMAAAVQALMDVGLATGKPVGLGITGPRMTDEQAMARVDAAARAVDAAKTMHDLLRGL
ncbi:MAG TPA: 6,7-dimethyl-8-ribityllumazine synthase [Thermoplasmata archaeon]|nr:6,7-dimethyl-8-ribityllumazine synthase [Thermoplasmata archaeon]